MKSLSIAILFTLAFALSGFGQAFSDAVARVRQIKLLQSTRDDVKRILREYDATDDDWHYQEFSKDGLTIDVEYSSGTCDEDADENDASEIWNVREWTVTRVEISPGEPIAVRKAGLNMAAFRKEPRYPDDQDSLVFFDKAAGVAVKTSEDGIETIIFFPSRANRNKLCRTSTAAKGFYTRRGWFSQAKPYDNTGCVNYIADVTELNLSAIEIDISSSAISVSTVAIDPENDVLTYNYTVTGGKILGTGANVTWDLADVAPGTYKITAAVDDGCGLCGKTVTKTVVVK